MAGETDKLKGRAKQAAGDITGDEELAREGEADEASGDMKDLVDKAADKVDEGIDKLRGSNS